MFIKSGLQKCFSSSLTNSQKLVIASVAWQSHGKKSAIATLVLARDDKFIEGPPLRNRVRKFYDSPIVV